MYDVIIFQFKSLIIVEFYVQELIISQRSAIQVQQMVKFAPGPWLCGQQSISWTLHLLPVPKLDSSSIPNRLSRHLKKLARKLICGIIFTAEPETLIIVRCESL